MKRLTRHAIVAALALAAAARAAAAQTPDGQALYRQYCRACHGPTGVAPEQMRNQYRNIPTLADSAFLAARSDDSVLAVLRHGARRGRDMGSFSAMMSEPQMRAVVAYVRTLARRRAQ